MYANLSELLTDGVGSGNNSEHANTLSKVRNFSHDILFQVGQVTGNSELDSSFGLPRIDEDQFQENNNISPQITRVKAKQESDYDDQSGKLANLKLKNMKIIEHQEQV